MLLAETLTYRILCRDIKGYLASTTVVIICPQTPMPLDICDPSINTNAFVQDIVMALMYRMCFCSVLSHSQAAASSSESKQQANAANYYGIAET